MTLGEGDLGSEGSWPRFFFVVLISLEDLRLSAMLCWFRSVHNVSLEVGGQPASTSLSFLYT